MGRYRLLSHGRHQVAKRSRLAHITWPCRISFVVTQMAAIGSKIQVASGSTFSVRRGLPLGGFGDAPQPPIGAIIMSFESDSRPADPSSRLSEALPRRRQRSRGAPPL